MSPNTNQNNCSRAGHEIQTYHVRTKCCEHTHSRTHLSDLRLREVHKNFCENNRLQVTLNFYYKYFNHPIISFAVLGQGEYETC